MKKTCALLFAGLLALQPSGAAEAPAAETIVVKNKSSFVFEGSGRSPFWPIGWKPSSPNSTAQRVTAALSPSAFAVTSIAVERSGRYAIINGKVMGEGQVFGVQVGNQVHQITVKAIQDGQVILTQQNEEFPVPLRRR